MLPRAPRNTLKTARFAAGPYKFRCMQTAAKSWRSASTAQVSAAILAVATLQFASLASAQVYLTEGTNISVDVTGDGRMTMDLLGDLWIVPPDGGEAESLVQGRKVARRPRWSPDATSIVYQASIDGRDELRLYDLESRVDRSLADGNWANRYPDWHPDGDRVAFLLVTSRHRIRPVGSRCADGSGLAADAHEGATKPSRPGRPTAAALSTFTSSTAPGRS